MATQQLQLVCDSSTLTNYKQWAKAISDWFRTLGYTNTGDTGQLNGAGGGVGGAAGWAGLAATPGSGAYFYEIFQSPDAPTFYVKMEYGNGAANANSPSIRITLANGTNGSGTVTGAFTEAHKTNDTMTPPSTTTQYECNFCGSGSKIAIMMWRNAPANQGQIAFGIQRSLDATGAEVVTAPPGYVTVWAFGNNSSALNNTKQQSLVFGVGAMAALGSNFTTGNYRIGFGARGVFNSVSVTGQGFIPIDWFAPMVGFWDNECTVFGCFNKADYAEGVTFTVTLYGVTKTYMPSSIGSFGTVDPGSTNGGGLAMEYD